ncbi:MAG TPA: septum formation initiator family protein [Panacibacter sp.]|nr:septum formation initiator family protein [Panacibacter sp.]HNP42690.1 septum formation initiator family protein [Panacibacter sp.]
MTTSSRIIYAATNKYLVASVIFAVIILFTDHNNLFEQMQRQSELSDLATKKAYYQQEISNTRKELSDLSNNAAAIEKYAREKFLMKRDNEDVFVVLPPSPGSKK